MTLKNILIWTGSIVVTFILLFFAYKLTNNPVKTDFQEINKIRASDQTKWSRENKNILIEYSDIQCPACKGFYDVLKTFEASSSPDFAITQKTTLVFRHFPLYQIHKNAFSAGYSAEAAGNQNKFWEMVNILYDKQTEWSALSNPKDYFIKVAKSLKLDTEKFQKDIDSKEVKDKVQSDLTEGESVGVNSTPTFFLNGQKVDVNSFEEFKTKLKNL